MEGAVNLDRPTRYRDTSVPAGPADVLTGVQRVAGKILLVLPYVSDVERARLLSETSLVELVVDGMAERARAHLAATEHRTAPARRRHWWPGYPIYKGEM